ncbi:hypothetical protein BDP27DRAFT_1232731 [Rhodocollybia butyracea]|uniref:Uncharacterized protein n=1 Tax=Rhodocollybia butyracea TaxID=206335 RepID=A0A9P5PGS9_9AGAR|nr:hypothetical protein BDP27DRAFT_1232731 [Rhodocollybia butyracea]
MFSESSPSGLAESQQLPSRAPGAYRQFSVALQPTSDAVDPIFGRDEIGRTGDTTPYIEEPPAYSSSGSNEPVTLAMYLFKFGFCDILPFWIVGACILFSPLRQPQPSSGAPSTVWLPEKTPAEREEILQKMRGTEIKWAKRCLIALGIFIILILSVGVGVGVGIERRR